MSVFKAYFLALSLTTAVTVGQTPTYVPGALDVFELDMYLSQGMTARIIAISGQLVEYSNGTLSTQTMHDLPDGAGKFANANTNAFVCSFIHLTCYPQLAFGSCFRRHTTRKQRWMGLCE